MSLGYSGSFTVTKSREFRCDTCGARCTRSINGDLEYGHLIGCPHRPDSFRRSTSDGGRRYKPDDANGGASA